MKTTKKSLLFLSLCLAALVASCHKSDELPQKVVGAWVRMDDRYEGMIIDFSNDSGSGTTGTLIFAPNEAYQGGFRIGDLKIKGIEKISEDEYECDSLGKTAEYSVASHEFYSRDIIYIRAGKELILRQKKGQDMSVGEWQRWVRLEDNESHQSNYHFGKGLLAQQQEEPKAAAKHYYQSVKADGNNAAAQNAYAWCLATSEVKRVRDGKKAIKHAQKACELTQFDNADYLDTLAAAHARAGNYTRAVEYQTKACLGYHNAPDDFLSRLQHYRNQKPYTEGDKLLAYSGPAPSSRNTSGASPLATP